MRVAIISTYADKIIRFRSELILSILDKGHIITILGSEPEELCINELSKFNIEYVRIPFKRFHFSPLKEIRFIIRTIKILKPLDFDVLIIYGIRLAPSITISSKLAGIKQIYAIINGIGTLFSIKGIKGKLIRVLAYPLLFFGLRKCNKVFFQNNDDLNLFTRLGLISKRKSYLVNGSGVNLEKFRPAPLPKENLFLFVGRIIRDKGVIEFINSARKVKEIYPNTKFILIGPFDENLTSLSENDFKLYIEKEVIEHINWTDNIYYYLKKCYVFVLPSYHEGTPRTILEAMAVGRPIITTDAPGCRETVIDGINGFLVPINNTDKLVDKIIWMIENREKAQQMGQESLRLCRDKYDVNKVNAFLLKEMDL